MSATDERVQLRRTIRIPAIGVKRLTDPNKTITRLAPGRDPEK